jgi:hypothetical protein
MITFQKATEFWIRHDRQNVQMSIAEIRAATVATEDLATKVEGFVESRIERLTNRKVLALLATPLLLQEGRVDVADGQIRQLLRQPPAYRAQGGMTLAEAPHSRILPTLQGVSASDKLGRSLELFRNGHLELLWSEFNYLLHPRQGQPPLVLGWAIAEVVRNFMHLLKALRDRALIPDPYMVTLAAIRIAGNALNEAGQLRSAINPIPHEENVWRESDHLILHPVQVPLGEDPDSSAKLIMDRFWNAFHFEQCPFFDPEGRFFIPTR